MYKKSITFTVLFLWFTLFIPTAFAAGNILNKVTDQSTAITGSTTPNTPFSLTSSESTIIFPLNLQSNNTGTFNVPLPKKLIAGTTITFTNQTTKEQVNTIVSYTGKNVIQPLNDKDKDITGTLSPAYTFHVYANSTKLATNQKSNPTNNTFSIKLANPLKNGTIISIKDAKTNKLIVSTKVLSTSIQVNELRASTKKLTGKSTPGYTLEILYNNKSLKSLKVATNGTYSFTFSKRPVPKTSYTLKLKSPKGIVVNHITVKVKEPYIPNGKVMGTYKGTKVEIVKRNGPGSYVIRYANGNKKTVSSTHIRIPKNPATLSTRLFKEEIEWYVNATVKKNKKYHVWVDLPRQRTYVLKNVKNNWVLERDFLCASGNNWTPTPRGNYTITFRKWGFYSGNVRVHHATRFLGPYYFHTVLYNRAGTKIVDNTLGKRASHGCVRLAPENAKYISTLPNGTSVWIN